MPGRDVDVSMWGLSIFGHTGARCAELLNEGRFDDREAASLGRVPFSLLLGDLKHPSAVFDMPL